MKRWYAHDACGAPIPEIIGHPANYVLHAAEVDEVLQLLYSQAGNVASLVRRAEALLRVLRRGTATMLDPEPALITLTDILSYLNRDAESKLALTKLTGEIVKRRRQA